MANKLPGGVFTAHKDTFAADRLPPKSLLPDFDFSATPELSAYSDYMNIASELLDDSVNKGFKNNYVVHLGEVSWTYSELLDWSNRIAEVLTQDCGLVTGNRVLLRAPNTFEFQNTHSEFQRPF